MSTARPELPYPCVSQAKSRVETRLLGQVWGISENRDRKLSLECVTMNSPCKGKSLQNDCILGGSIRIAHAQ